MHGLFLNFASEFGISAVIHMDAIFGNHLPGSGSALLRLNNFVSYFPDKRIASGAGTIRYHQYVVSRFGNIEYRG